MKKGKSVSHDQRARARPQRIHLPGFLIDDEIGLGDAIKRMTYAMGIKACSGCEKRAAALNQRMVFTSHPAGVDR